MQDHWGAEPVLETMGVRQGITEYGVPAHHRTHAIPANWRGKPRYLETIKYLRENIETPYA